MCFCLILTIVLDEISSRCDEHSKKVTEERIGEITVWKNKKTENLSETCVIGLLNFLNRRSCCKNEISPFVEEN